MNNSISVDSCPCHNPQANADVFSTSDWGMDNTHNRFAEIRIYTCKHCSTQWLHYFVEYEAFSQSGRWYRGKITPQQLAELTPEKAVAFLESLENYIYGGSFFNIKGQWGSGTVRANLL
jgi:hypothetical protein